MNKSFADFIADVGHAQSQGRGCYGGTIFQELQREGAFIHLYSADGQLMSMDEIWRKYPVPTNGPAMWGTPWGHLKLYKPFGGSLPPCT